MPINFKLQKETISTPEFGEIVVREMTLGEMENLNIDGEGKSLLSIVSPFVENTDGTLFFDGVSEKDIPVRVLMEDINSIFNKLKEMNPHVFTTQEGTDREKK